MTPADAVAAVAGLDRWRAYHQGNQPPSMVRAADGPWILRSDVLAVLAGITEDGRP